MSRFVIALLALVALPSAAQTDAERARGYLEDDGAVTFVFDPALYGFSPSKVAVTGPFRGWSSDDDDPDWAMTQVGDVWTLALEDADAAGFGPSTPFKFRGDGRWLDPAPAAENVAGGNLIYRFGEVAPRLIAEVRGDDAIWVALEGASRPLLPSAYRVERWDGTPVAIDAVTPNQASTALLTVRGLDPDQVHTVTAVLEDGAALSGRARFDGLWRDLASDRALGATPTDSSTTFAVFAPRADSVFVVLYPGASGPPMASLPLTRQSDGVWTGEWEEDFHRAWYDLAVFTPVGPESAGGKGVHVVSDPYALVSDDSWGRARIWRDEFQPPRPVEGGRPSMHDVVAYEVHVQDFTDRLPDLEDGVGPLEAFATPGLTNARGEPVGIDYLERLGVNTVHLMPVQEYLHYPNAAWQAAFEDDPFMQEQGIATENYQWGYRTTHAFAVESRFRSEGDEPGDERERFRDLVDALHARGMAVVIDVVFNHTGENMEGVEQLLTFNGIDKWYYYRLDDDGNHIGAFGNETKSENRPMMQRWMLDQLRHFVDVFGVDGFRIDLAGQTDEQTLRWIQASLGPDVLIYGEPWIASNDPDYEANPSWDWYKADSPITFFQDEARNAWKGSPLDNPTPAASSRGFAGGDAAMRDAALQGVANDYDEEPTPNGGIGYLDIHDNWALADRFASCQTGECAWDGRQGVLEAEMRIAATLLMTSLGPIVMHGGTEIARSKGVAPLPEEIDGEWERTEMSIAPIYIKGRGDTYNLRTANGFDWRTVGLEDGPADYLEMHDWWQDLIALRESEVGEVFRIGDVVPEGWVRVLEVDRGHALAYVVGDTVMVAVNVGDASAVLEAVPDGEWVLDLESRADGVTDLPIRDDAGARRLRGRSVTLGPRSARVWIRL